MARIRTIKPELAAHEGLYDLEVETKLPIRFAWCMLFTVCDREGRFQWRPRTLKAQILPHDEVEFSRVLDAWVTRGFIQKYRVKNDWFGWIPTFTKHQVINNREGGSDLPSIKEASEVFQPLTDACGTRALHVPDACTTRDQSRKEEGRKEGKGKEGREGNTTAASQPTQNPNSTQQLCATPEPEFERLKAIYPKRAGSNPWPRALKAIHARLREGYGWLDLTEGLERYAEFVRTTGKERTEYVMQAATFFGPEERFLEPWTLPATRAENQQDANIDAAREWLEGSNHVAN